MQKPTDSPGRSGLEPDSASLADLRDAMGPRLAALFDWPVKADPTSPLCVEDLAVLLEKHGGPEVFSLRAGPTTSPETVRRLVDHLTAQGPPDPSQLTLALG